jgi:hypothetical protein
MKNVYFSDSLKSWFEMKKSVTFSVLLFSVFVLHCQSLKSQEVKKIILDTSIKMVPYVTDILSIEKYVALKSILDIQLDDAEKVVIRNDTIFIFESKRLSIWAPDGTFICSYGNAIQGCEDITSIRSVNPMSEKMDLPTDFALVPGKSQVAILDNLKSQIYVYDFKGRLINKIYPDLRHIAYFTWSEFGNLLFSSFDEKQGGEYNNFVVTGLDGKMVKGFLPYSKDERLNLMASTSFPTFRNKQLLFRPFDDRIFELHGDTTIKAYLQFDFESANPNDELKKHKGDVHSLLEGLKKNSFYFMWGFQELDQYYVVNYIYTGIAYKLFTNIVLKDGSEQYRIQHKPMNLDPLGIEFFYSYNDMLVAIVNPLTMKQNLSHTLPLVKQQLNETVTFMEKIIAEAGNQDLPVVLFFKLKDTSTRIIR